MPLSWARMDRGIGEKMPENISGLQFVGIICGTLLVGATLPFIIHWIQVRRGKRPPDDQGS